MRAEEDEMSQIRRGGPRRRIRKHGVVDVAPWEPRHVLVLSCGHTVRRYVFRLQHRGMAECWECGGQRMGQR